MLIENNDSIITNFFTLFFHFDMDARRCVLDLAETGSKSSDMKQHVSFVSEDNNVTDSKIMCLGERHDRLVRH